MKKRDPQTTIQNLYCVTRSTVYESRCRVRKPLRTSRLSGAILRPLIKIGEVAKLAVRDRSWKFRVVLTRSHGATLQVHWFVYHRNFTARYLREITRGTGTTFLPSALNKPRNWFTFRCDSSPPHGVAGITLPSRGSEKSSLISYTSLKTLSPPSPPPLPPSLLLLTLRLLHSPVDFRPGISLLNWLTYNPTSLSGRSFPKIKGRISFLLYKTAPSAQKK